MMRVTEIGAARSGNPRKGGWGFPGLVGLGVLTLLVFGGAASAYCTAADSLWQMAEAYMGRRLWLPGEVWANEKVYNRTGGLEEERTMVVGVSARPDQAIQRHLITAEENGEEVAAALRAEIEGPTTLRELVGDSPFIPAEGQRVTHWRTGEQRQIKGRTCIGFGYQMTTAEMQIDGVAWLDRITGLPLEMTAEVISVPFKEDGVKVTSYTETNHFAISGRGDCLLMDIRSRMGISVWGFKGRVDSHQRFSRHWLWQQGADADG